VSKSQNQSEQAKRLLVNYFRNAARGSWNFDSDNAAEIEDIVDCIVGAAVATVKEQAAQIADGCAPEKEYRRRCTCDETECHRLLRIVRSEDGMYTLAIQDDDDGLCAVEVLKPSAFVHRLAEAEDAGELWVWSPEVWGNDYSIKIDADAIRAAFGVSQAVAA
jgi:hypothetical protein